MTGAGLGTVHSILTHLTRHIAVGPVKSRLTQALSGSNVTNAVKTVAAVILTVIPISPVGTAHLTPVPDPAGVAVGALSVDAVAEVAIFTRGTHIQAVLSEEAWQAHLITLGPVPAPLTGHTPPLCYLTGLLAFTVATPIPAVLSVEPCGTRFPAELPPVPRCAGT